MTSRPLICGSSRVFEDHPVACSLEEVECLAPVGGDGDGVPFLKQELGEDLTQRLVILHQ
jgi:hypothetical protein